MRIAIVHDYLNQFGGAERVLIQLLKIFPEADVYTLLYDRALLEKYFPGRNIRTSFLDMPMVRRAHRWFLPLMPLAASSLNLRDRYDVIVSATAGYAKGIRYHPRTRHIAYCYTPLRYAWESRYIPEKLRGQMPGWRPAALTAAIKPAAAYLRWWDYRAAQKPDRLIAISHHIAQKIKQYYRREAAVLYPPLDTKTFFYDPAVAPGDYFLAVGRLLHYKNFHLLCEAFRRLPWPLKIIGVGPEARRLQRDDLPPTVEFLSFVKSDDELRRLYAGARALIFPGEEDFGLVMAEAQACGTPVIALAAGGALEIVEEGNNGTFFQHASVPDIEAAIRRFQTMKFSRNIISQSAQKFASERFARELQKIVRL